MYLYIHIHIRISINIHIYIYTYIRLLCGTHPAKSGRLQQAATRCNVTLQHTVRHVTYTVSVHARTHSHILHKRAHTLVDSR